MIDEADLFNEKLQEWEHFYNYARPHGALGGQTPYERLRQKTALDVRRRCQSHSAPSVYRYGAATRLVLVMNERVSIG